MITNVITEGKPMHDRIEKIGDSLIQHGKANNRIYLLKLEGDDIQEMLSRLDSLALEKGYTKIFAKIRADHLPLFLLKGYTTEAYIPRFYNGETDCVMASKFMDENRKKIPRRLMDNFSRLIGLNGKKSGYLLPSGYEIRKLQEKDAESVSAIFISVFETYPFPVFDPNYILQTMRSNSARYFGVWSDNTLIGISTAETDFEKENAEMTDFAVLPEFRGQRLAYHLLSFMEVEMKKEGIKTAYTIARLAEPGMNLTFMRSGYNFSGTLINNTNIGGSVESMNVFYKFL